MTERTYTCVNVGNMYVNIYVFMCVYVLDEQIPHVDN